MKLLLVVGGVAGVVLVLIAATLKPRRGAALGAPWPLERKPTLLTAAEQTLHRRLVIGPPRPRRVGASAASAGCPVRAWRMDAGDSESDQSALDRLPRGHTGYADHRCDRAQRRNSPGSKAPGRGRPQGARAQVGRNSVAGVAYPGVA